MSDLVNGFDPHIVDEMASKVGPAGIDIAYQRLGSRDAPVVLLIMGVAAQLIAWPDAFCDALVDRGLQVVRFDNRDVGLSTHLADAPTPDLPAALAGDLSSGRAYDRSHDPIGVARQAIASVASGDRTERLRHLEVPTLVIHGLADLMCDVSGGRATAEAIPGAELVLIEGMGHNLPPGLRSPLAARIAEFVWRAEDR